MMKRRLFLQASTLFVVGCSEQGGVYAPKQNSELFDLPLTNASQLNLGEQMRKEGFALGAKVYLRIFKESRVLEAWLLQADGKYHLYRKFPICTYSGGLGPKQKEGDYQSPEGFYQVVKNQLNPHSNYHLSFNLGYPNQYDRAHGYTGNYLMVHGNCVSKGCYAMDDRQIEVIYALVSSAQQRGQYAVPVHIFPFEMSEHNMLMHQDSEWRDFWQMLRPAYDYFEQTHIPPAVSVENARYQIIPPFGNPMIGVQK